MKIAEPIDKISFKKKVLEKAKEKQKEIINNLRTSIRDIQESEMNIDDGQYDDGQEAFDETSNILIDKLADELNFAVAEMDLLNKMQIADKPLDHVAIGAVVETNKRTFYPSVSVEKFKVDGKTIYGLSEKAPLFLTMKDKKEGESFAYDGEQYNITEII